MYLVVVATLNNMHVMHKLNCCNIIFTATSTTIFYTFVEQLYLLLFFEAADSCSACQLCGTGNMVYVLPTDEYLQSIAFL